MSLPGLQPTQCTIGTHYTTLCDNRPNGLLTVRTATRRYASLHSALPSASEASAAWVCFTSTCNIFSVHCNFF